MTQKAFYALYPSIQAAELQGSTLIVNLVMVINCAYGLMFHSQTIFYHSFNIAVKKLKVNTDMKINE